MSMQDQLMPGDTLETCKDCDRGFIIQEKERHWYEDRELSVPRRCGACRKEKKMMGASYVPKNRQVQA